jgi:hypothetical protein
LIQIKPGSDGTRLLGARSWLLSFSDLFPMSSDGALFGTGAAVGAFMTKQTPALALGIPVIVLLVVLLRCETERTMGRFP